MLKWVEEAAAVIDSCRLSLLHCHAAVFYLQPNIKILNLKNLCKN